MNYRQRQMIKEAYQSGHESGLNEGIGHSFLKSLLPDPQDLRNYLKSIGVLKQHHRGPGKELRVMRSKKRRYLPGPEATAAGPKPGGAVRNPFYRPTEAALLRTRDSEKTKMAYDAAKEFFRLLDKQAELEKQLDELDPALVTYILRRQEIRNLPIDNASDFRGGGSFGR